MLAGQLITGAVLSTTVTVCAAVVVWLKASVAEYVIVVVPTGKLFPDGTPVRVVESAPWQLSFALAVPRVASLTTAPQDAAPEPVLTVTFAGGVTVGAVVSTTLTVRVTALAA